jgi:hypothetical protein
MRRPRCTAAPWLPIADGTIALEMGTGAGYLAARGYVGEIALAELLTRPALVYLASPFFGFGAGRPLPDLSRRTTLRVGPRQVAPPADRRRACDRPPARLYRPHAARRPAVVGSLLREDVDGSFSPQSLATAAPGRMVRAPVDRR